MVTSLQRKLIPKLLLCAACEETMLLVNTKAESCCQLLIDHLDRRRKRWPGSFRERHIFLRIKDRGEVPFTGNSHQEPQRRHVTGGRREGARCGADTVQGYVTQVRKVRASQGHALLQHSGPAMVQTKEFPPSTQRFCCRTAFAEYPDNIPRAGSCPRTALSLARAQSTATQ